MIRFSKNLYIGDSIRHVGKVKWKIVSGRGQLNVHLLTIAQNEQENIDCFHNAMLKQKFFRRQHLQVVGIAGSYEEAISLITDITKDVMEQTGDVLIREYLLEHFR